MGYFCHPNLRITITGIGHFFPNPGLPPTDSTSGLRDRPSTPGSFGKQAIDVSLGQNPEGIGLGGFATKLSKPVVIPTFTASVPRHSKP